MTNQDKEYRKRLVKGYDEIPQPKGKFVNLFEKYRMITSKYHEKSNSNFKIS